MLKTKDYGLALWAAGALAAVGLGVAPGPPDTVRAESREPGALSADRVPLVTGKEITPAGKHVAVGSFPLNMAPSPDGRFVVVTCAGFNQFLSVVRTADGALMHQVPLNGRAPDGKREGLYYGLTFHGNRLYASRGAEDRVAVYTLDSDGRLAPEGRVLADPSGSASPRNFAGLALAEGGRRLLAVCNQTYPARDNKGSVTVFETGEPGKVLGRVECGGYPLAIAALSSGPSAGRKAYVASERDGTLTVFDPSTLSRIRTVEVGSQPVHLLLDGAQERLFVANAGSDTISVLDTSSDRVVRTVLLRPDDARGLPGATPTGMALSPDERRLYVTLADMNAVAVVALPEGRLQGYLPTGWYPTAVHVTSDGRALLVTSAKGIGPRNPNRPTMGERFPRAGNSYIQSIIQGTISWISQDLEKDLAGQTRQVIRNNRLTRESASPRVAGFRNPGIEHVIYVVKENRTYDQVLGDLPRGDGDASLCLFPREVTPNQHALAERFVLLDNFYCCAEVSADGWNWTVSGMSSAFTSRNAPYGYSGRGRQYDYEGQNNGVAVDLQGIPDVARAPGGYIWDLVAEKGLSFRNYGFFVDVDLDEQGVPIAGTRPASSITNGATKRALQPHTDESFRQFDMAYADSDAPRIHGVSAPAQMERYGRFGARSRFEEWKREFDGYVRAGRLPRFMMLRLPNDHTQGTSPGYFSPRSMVADNDYALGQVVEAVSRSRFWSKTAIFVIEDDAQNGFDHIDAHRSIAFVISPYVKKAGMDHRFYNTDSVLRTMELLLGLPPMCQYDAVASPLRVFDREAVNSEHYSAILPAREIIADVNGRNAYRATDSTRMNFTREDSVPDEELNDILWHAIRGAGVPKPPIRKGLRLMHGAADD